MASVFDGPRAILPDWPRRVLRILLAAFIVWAVFAFAWYLLRTPANVFDEIANGVEDAPRTARALNPLAHIALADSDYFDADYEPQNDGGKYDGVALTVAADELCRSLSDNDIVVDPDEDVVFSVNGQKLWVLLNVLNKRDGAPVAASYSYDRITKTLAISHRSDNSGMDSQGIATAEKVLFEVSLPIYFDAMGNASAFSAGDLGQFTYNDGERGYHSNGVGL